MEKASVESSLCSLSLSPVLPRSCSAPTMKRGFLLHKNQKKPRGDQAPPTASSPSSAFHPDAFVLSFRSTSLTKPKVLPELLPIQPTIGTLSSDSLIQCRLQSTDGITECLLTPRVVSKILKTPGFPAPIKHNSTPAYRISETNCMGLGMFATRALNTGDLIIAERPLLVCIDDSCIRELRKVQNDKEAHNDIAEAIFQLVVDRLTKENKAHFYALHNSRLGGEEEKWRLVGIMSTNAYSENFNVPGIVRDNEESYSVVMKDCSRINHSCCPNVTTIFDIPSFSLQFRAARPISGGEEITYAYAGVERAYVNRSAMLKPYGITCRCPPCLSPTLASDTSCTTMASRVTSIEQRLFNHFHADTPASTTDMARKMLEISGIFQDARCLVREMEKEGMQACEGYVRAVKFMYMSFIPVRHVKTVPSNFDFDNRDIMKQLLVKTKRVVLSHQGEEHDDYVRLEEELNAPWW
ncbi:hypothetical protein BDQ17DRAFT_1362401 [Cyathus striatus]|nr:hypothetical protein BDQ17DRAFT_1362401 [Cyathus striatus]